MIVYSPRGLEILSRDKGFTYSHTKQNQSQTAMSNYVLSRNGSKGSILLVDIKRIDPIGFSKKRMPKHLLEI